LQIHRWLPGRRIVLVGDTACAAVDFLGAVRTHVSVVTRLRLDANLYAPAPPKRPGRVSRWQLEVMFQDVRAHLGVETQRQWSDLAILRTTPALLDLFSLVTLWAT
jgi:hypothetical protein